MTTFKLALLALALVAVIRLVLPGLRRRRLTAFAPLALLLGTLAHGVLVSLDTELVPFAVLGIALSIGTVVELRGRRSAPATRRPVAMRLLAAAGRVTAGALAALGAYLTVALASDPVVRPQQVLSPVVTVGGTTVLAEHPYLRTPRDLAFNPLVPGELWVVNGRDHSVAIIHDATSPEPRIEYRRDGKAAHFMHRPSAIAFGSPRTTIGIPGTFATAQESMDDAVPFARREFMGPTLFSSSLDVFARPVAPGLLGSHLDMLHESPLAMGIAWERDHVYWVFGGYLETVSRYDFVEDHGVGHDDHSNGVIRHYGRGVVSRVPGVPSHLAFEPSSGSLYVADTGNSRVLTLDTRSGRLGEAGPGWEASVDTRWIEDADYRELVPPGSIDLPSGLALADGHLYVGDHATGIIHVLRVDGTPVGTIDSGAGERALMGLTIGQDGRLYGVDAVRGRVLRFDAAGVVAVPEGDPEHHAPAESAPAAAEAATRGASTTIDHAHQPEGRR